MIEQSEDDDVPLLVPGKVRAEAVRRLQIGLTGLFAMILLVSLANIIKDRAQESDLSTVSDADASLSAEETPVPANKDPLADAGLVPELSTGSSGTPSGGGNAKKQP